MRSPEFLSHFTATIQPVESNSNPNLLDAYLGGNLVIIYDDTQQRPQHYTSRQHDILNAFVAGRPSTATDAEKNDLVLTWMRPTAVAEATQRTIAAVTGSRHDDDAIVLESGKTLGEPGTFEKQDFDSIIIL